MHIAEQKDRRDARDIQCYRVPAIFPIASTRACQVYPYVATLFFTLPYILHPT